MFYFDNFYGKKILKSDLLKDYDCFFTTREFALAQGALDNLKTEVIKNREFLKEHLSAQNLYFAGQVHGKNVEIINSSKQFYEKTDALISDIQGSVMVLNYADCVPIILYSKKDNAGACIHAGWRGTAANIAYETVMKMKNDLNIKPENITALIGPSIGKCCFETHEDVFNKLVKDKSQTKFYENKDGKYFIDLKLLNHNQLSESGVVNIDVCTYCTCCMSDIFFSYRKENGITARHSAVVQIKRG